jgi:putative phage-type endonuclease
MIDQINDVDLIDISNMTDEDWRNTRRSYVGGSDAGKIYGSSKYGSPMTVFFDKKGVVPYVEKNAARRGKLLEPVVRDFTVRELGVTIEQSKYMFVSKVHTFMSANIDGFFIANTPVVINGVSVQGFGGHEIKTSKTGDGFAADEVPDDYYCQVQHYMAVTGLLWFILSVYEIMSDDVHHYYIPRNDEFIARLIAAEGDFWENYVLKNVTPAPIGIENEDDLVTGMYSPSDGVIVLSDAELELCKIRSDASAREKAAKEEKEKADIALKLAITSKVAGAHSIGKLSAVAGSYTISWSRFAQRRVDGDLLKKDGLYDKYSKEGESGRFVVSPPKVAV